MADQNIYISDVTDPSEDGSIEHPYDTFADINWTTGGANSIFDWVAAGDDVFINLKRGASWGETLTIGTSGASPGLITIQAYDSGATPIIDGESTRANCIISSGKKDYVSLNDIVTTGATSRNMYINGGATHNVGWSFGNMGFSDGNIGAQIDQTDDYIATNIALDTLASHGWYTTDCVGATIDVITADEVTGESVYYANISGDFILNNVTITNGGGRGIYFLTVTGTSSITGATWYVGTEGIPGTGCIGSNISISTAAGTLTLDIDGVASHYSGIHNFELAGLTLDPASSIKNVLVTYATQNGLRLNNVAGGLNLGERTDTLGAITSQYNTLDGIRYDGTVQDVVAYKIFATYNARDNVSLNGDLTQDNWFLSCFSTYAGTFGVSATGDGYTAHDASSNNWFVGCIAAFNLNSGHAYVDSASGYIINNTIAQNGVVGHETGSSRRGGIMATGTSAWVCRNNIGYDNYPWEIKLAATSKAGCDLNYNVYYHPDDVNIASLDDGSTELTWANYIGDADVDESNSLNQDPILKDPANSDFSLLPTSPCINIGTDPYSDGDGNIYDFTGNIQVWDDTTDSVVAPGGVIDIGAYEFANHPNGKSYFVELSSIGGDWLYSEGIPGTPAFLSVKLVPGAADDKLVLKEGSATGPTFVRLLSGDAEQRIDDEIEGCRPFLDYSECVLSTGSLVIFELKVPIG